MVLTELHQFCSESHMLIFQWDGFVLSPDKWTDEFLNYDYIGAPWIPGQFQGVNNAMVGNSGFSLISQKAFGLIKMFKLTTTDDNSADDTVICLEHRELLERHGINFAPLKLAAEFSIERHKMSNLMQGGSLGFHGSFNLPDAISEELLIQSIPEINLRLRHHLEDLYMLIVVCELRGYQLFINEYFKEIKNSEIYNELYRIDHSDAPISRLGRGLFLQRYFLESSG